MVGKINLINEKSRIDEQELLIVSFHRFNSGSLKGKSMVRVSVFTYNEESAPLRLSGGDSFC